MQVIIAIDSFKGSLSSQKAGEAIAEGMRRVYPEAAVTIIPMADGGEGTVEALVSASHGKLVSCMATSPIGEMIEADFGILPDGTAVLEMAAASGLPLVPKGKRNPLLTTTWGTGQLIKKALDLGAKEIVIGIGGSATNDGGAGMAQALGVKLLDAEGNELPRGGGALRQLAAIDMTEVDKRLASTKITVMCDVDNPLCGPQGASAIYGPQKGADPDMVVELDESLKHFANLIQKQLGINIIDVPGSGAAGGLGAGLIAFTGAELRTGIETILDTLGFDQMLSAADLIITGEGRIDGQSLYGKVPMGVAKRALKHNKPVIAVVGSIGPGSETLYNHGLNSIISIVDGPMRLEEAIGNAYDLAVNASERAFRLIKVGKLIG